MFKKGSEGLTLGGVGVAAGREFEDAGDGVGGFQSPGGETAGRFDKLKVIHELESLQRGVGDFSLDRADFARGSVKVGHDGWAGRPFVDGVDAAAVEVGSGSLLVLFGVGNIDRNGAPDAIWLVRRDGWAADLGIEKSADGEGLVAEDFAIKPESMGAVFSGGDRRGLAVILREDDSFDQSLQVPVFLEIGGEGVEEFGVLGRASLVAEIVLGFAKSFAEELGPNAVDGDAGGEGIFVLEQPLRKAKSVAGEGLGHGRKGRRGGGGHLIATGFVRATEKNVGGFGLAFLGHNRGGHGSDFGHGRDEPRIDLGEGGDFIGGENAVES